MAAFKKRFARRCEYAFALLRDAFISVSRSGCWLSGCFCRASTSALLSENACLAAPETCFNATKSRHASTKGYHPRNVQTFSSVALVVAEASVEADVSLRLFAVAAKRKLDHDLLFYLGKQQMQHGQMILQPHLTAKHAMPHALDKHAFPGLAAGSPPPIALSGPPNPPPPKKLRVGEALKPMVLHCSTSFGHAGKLGTEYICTRELNLTMSASGVAGSTMHMPSSTLLVAELRIVRCTWGVFCTRWRGELERLYF